MRTSSIPTISMPRAAISVAASDDTVVLAGKGHETYQIIGTERVAFDEAAIVRELVGP